MIYVSPYLKPIADHWDWQYQGACNNLDTEIFFLEDQLRGKAKVKKEKNAVSICNTCPVKLDCLNHALNTPELFGVWGGMTQDQRFNILKRREIFFE